MSLATVHFMLVCTWLGLVCAETVIEFAQTDDATLKLAAKYHFLIDGLLEIPLVLSVLGTGAALAWRAWPLPTAMQIKVVLGVIAIVANLYCAVLVVNRYRTSEDVGALRRLSWQVRFAWTAVPFGLGALYIGLTR